MLQTGELEIDPLDLGNVQPSSIDLCLGPEIRTFREDRDIVLDGRSGQPMILVDGDWVRLSDSITDLIDLRGRRDRNMRDGCFVLHPDDFILATTKERLRIPVDLRASVEGKSSLGRIGLAVHSTAGFLDPGFEGTITLELSNIGRLPIVLFLDQLICQIAYYRLDAPAENPYGSAKLRSRYQGQVGATPARPVR